MQHPRNRSFWSFSEEEREVFRESHPQSLGGAAVPAKIGLPPTRSFRGCLYGEKTKGYRWHVVELNTNPRRRAEVLKGTQESLIAGKYIFGPGVMMCRGMVEGMVVP